MQDDNCKDHSGHERAQRDKTQHPFRANRGEHPCAIYCWRSMASAIEKCQGTDGEDRECRVRSSTQRLRSLRTPALRSSLLPNSRRHYQFFARLSSVRPAKTCFSLQFSSSSCFSFLASPLFMPPYLAFER